MIYADNTKSYVTCEGDHFLAQALGACYHEIRHWMIGSMLALNKDRNSSLLPKVSVTDLSRQFKGILAVILHPL